jgi:hypothetical protein
LQQADVKMWILKTVFHRPGMVVHNCPALRWLKQEGNECRASLGYIVEP